MRPLLNFHFRKQHRGRDRRDWHTARFRAANAIEHFRLLARDFDPVQGGHRCSYDIDAPHQFIPAAIGIDLPYQHGQDLERLRQCSGGERKSTFDVLEVKTVGLALLFDFIDQFLT